MGDISRILKLRNGNDEDQVCERLANFYNVSHKRRGVALIFLHEKFDYNVCTPRNTAEDLTNLQNVLTEMQFDIRNYRELTYAQIMNVLSQVAREDHSDADCLLICVLSHGADGYTFAKDQSYDQQELWKAFAGDACPSLAGKPKLFFMQGCRGDELDAGALIRNNINSDSWENDDNYIIPSMADVLIMFSDNDGYHSSIKPELGSKFIQILCQELEDKYKYHDVMSILTFVNQKMTLTNNTLRDQVEHVNIQGGNIISTLTRLMCFSSNKIYNPVKDKSLYKSKTPVCDQMADAYNLTHDRRGVALIFIHERFDDPECQPRHGAEADIKLLDFLSELGFEIRMYNDLKLTEITEVLSGVANEDHSDADCFLVCVSTSGCEEGIQSRDNYYHSDKFWEPFTGDKCKTLAGKPKLFFVQAGRGESIDAGVLVQDIDNKLYTIPAMSDFLIMYSTYAGYQSWRDIENGSWFIQNLCTELQNNCNTYDLMTILTYVNRRMAVHCQTNCPNKQQSHGKKQTANIVSTMTRLLHLSWKKKYTTRGGKSIKMPICEKMADCYNVSHDRRGVALIFFHEDYFDAKQGIKKDIVALDNVLNDLGFEVRIHRDLLYDEITQVLSVVAMEDHANADCLLICVITYGEDEKLYAKDRSYQPDELWTPFVGDKCKSLAGKPKLFFVQAHRGVKYDEGAAMRSSHNGDNYTIPAMADILVMHSTCKGYYSWRNPVDGSWLIQAMRKELKDKYNSHDFMTVLTFVNRRMALFFESKIPSINSMNNKKQVSSISSTLTRRIYFNSFKKSVAKKYVSKVSVSDKMADSYNFRHTHRGVALIFVQEQFEDNCYKPRKGIEKDKESLQVILSILGFEVRIYNDLEHAKIIEILANVAQEDHTDADCLLVCVMSHGNQEKIFARDGGYDTDKLWIPFSANLCKTLAGKPKLFLIQGGKNNTFDNTTQTENDNNYNVPPISDILVMYSTYKGYYSWRNTNRGSWFIEALCQEFKQNHRSSDLITMLTFVNRKVSIFYQSCVINSDRTMDKKKQVCTIASSLTGMMTFPLKNGT